MEVISLTVFVAEHDYNLRNLITYALRDKYNVSEFENAKDLNHAFRSTIPDLLLLDSKLPDNSDITILERLRKIAKIKKMPIIILSDTENEIEYVKALDAGAADYISKPFSMLKLSAKINAVLRMQLNTDADDNVLCIQNVTLNINAHTVMSDDKPVILTCKEFLLLQSLMENQKTVLSRKKILYDIWQLSREQGTRTVDMHIKTLRRKLGPGNDIIQTVRGFGYKAE